MTDQSKPSNPATLTGSHNVTSSPESASGPTRSGALDGPTIDLFGQEVVPVSRSARPEKKRASPTPATFGQAGFGSPESIVLSQSLANRLSERFEVLGSTLYQQTWKRKATPSGRPYLAHTASGRRTKDNDFTSWQTPKAATGKCQYQGGDPSKVILNLEGEADLSGWPTPAAAEFEQQDQEALRVRRARLKEEAGDSIRGVSEKHAKKQQDQGHGDPKSSERRGAGDMVDAERARLEGHGGNVDDGDQPRRVGAFAIRPATPSGILGGFWADAQWIECTDGKARPIKPGAFPLVASIARSVGPLGNKGVPLHREDPWEEGEYQTLSEEYVDNTAEGRVGRLRGYGNAINAEAAVAFIRAFREVKGEL